MKTTLLIISMLAVPAMASAQQAGNTCQPVTTTVQQVDPSGNVTLAGTSGCANRVVQANEAPNPCPPGDSLVAVNVSQLISAFGVHQATSADGKDGVERYFCASQLRGK